MADDCRNSSPLERDMLKNAGLSIFFLLIVSCFILISGGYRHTAWAEKAAGEFNIKQEGIKKDNIFNLFFGGAPLMPTENGILIIDAFLDENGNQQWDAGEPALEKALVCTLDDIEYPVPAFIPGLKNGDNYFLKCSGEDYHPTIEKKNVFIKKRGEIIKIEVPCQLPVSRTALKTAPEK